MEARGWPRMVTFSTAGHATSAHAAGPAGRSPRDLAVRETAFGLKWSEGPTGQCMPGMSRETDMTDDGLMTDYRLMPSC